MFGLILSIWLSVANAQEGVPISRVRVPVDSEAKVQTLPTIRDRMAEIRVTHCGTDLSDVLSDVRRPGIRTVTPINMGEESWLLRVDLSRPDTQIRATVVDGVLEISVYDDEQFQLDDIQDALSTEELFMDLFADGMILPPNVDLRPLFGSALAYPMTVQEIPFTSMTLTGDTKLSDWNDVDQARQRYLESQKRGVEGIVEMGDASYALGVAYLNEGLAMEAGFYLDKLHETPGNVPPMNFYLAKARSFLLQRKWDDARALLHQAYRYGADETSIVEGMAIISHETGIPSRSSTGRVLASLTAKPEALLLSGELLFIDGRYQESWEILEPLFANQMFSDPENLDLDQRLRLRLGDIAFFLGDNQKAQIYWRGTYPDIRQVRMIQVQMITEGSHAWVRSVPQLRVIAENGVSQNAAEAMYLIGQVYSKYGTQLDAVELWADFSRTYPELLPKTDVLDMLGVVYQDRIGALHRKGHWMRIAKTHEVGWVNQLQGVVEDPEVLISVADAYDRLGLSERALYALISDFGIGSNSGFYAPEAEFYLAELYFKSNRYYETYRTLDLMKSEKLSPGILNDVLFLEAKAHLAEGDLEVAKELLEVTARSKKYRTSSYVSLGVLARQEGDCESAIPFLRPTILPLEDRSTSDPLAFLYLSQCLGEVGEYEDAALVAKTLQEISGNPDEIQHAQYLQSQYAGAETVSLDAVEEGEDASVWMNLIEEQQKSNSFWKEYEEWQQSKE